MSQIDTENDKNLKILQFSKFRQTSWIGVFQKVNNEKVGTSSSLQLSDICNVLNEIVSN